jgi:hypothetical protein
VASGLALTMMARRSQAYLRVLEAYAQELETERGFGLVRTTYARMPGGIDSTVYLHLVYWTLVVVWAVLAAWYTRSLLGDGPG